MRHVPTRKEILALPKVELHRHVDGAVNPDLVWFLARKEGLRLPAKTKRGLRRFLRIRPGMPIEELLDVFGLVIACMQKPENIELVFYEQMLDLAAENIVYAELRFAPQYHTRGGLSLEAVIDAALRGIERGMRDTKKSPELTDVEARLIVCIARECDLETSKEVVRAALKFQDKSVCGIDLACNEAFYPPELHRNAYKLTFRSELKRTVHAGEFGDDRLGNIEKAILFLRADRLGHAIPLFQSQEIMDICRDRGISVESCPISNLITKSIANIRDLGLDVLREEEILFSINSDDPALFGVSLSETIRRTAKAYQWSLEDVREIMRNSLKTAFISHEEKLKLLEKHFRSYKTNPSGDHQRDFCFSLYISVHLCGYEGAFRDIMLNGMKKVLNIASISAELAPFVKVGGLGEVARALPEIIAKKGHRVVAITPLYRTVKEHTPDLEFVGEAEVGLGGGRSKKALFWRVRRNGVAVYFIDEPSFFSRYEKVYTSQFENDRFYFFNLAVLALLRHINYIPDIIQCHDWHTGLIPYFLHKKPSLFPNTASLFTIHNLAFQMGTDWWRVPPRERDDGERAPEALYGSGRGKMINFALRGIQYADLISTVSEHYAEEILTKQFGENLHNELKKRKQDLFGIVNGVDYRVYNPETDPGLKVPYNTDTIERKARNKRELQRLFGLVGRKDVALIGMVSRITEQKGFELVLSVLDLLMRLKVQLVIMGTGDPQYEEAFKRARVQYLEKFGFMSFRQKYETLVYAGSDFFLMPSRFEPCGLGQLISLRYGSIPIVHAVGGLSETITDFNPRTRRGNGFVFTSYDSRMMLSAVVRALENWLRNGEEWDTLVRNSMREVFSWDIPARRYLALFRRAIREHQKESLQ